MALSRAEAQEVLLRFHEEVQQASKQRRYAAQGRTRFAKMAQAEGATVSDLQALLGLSRTGVVKILAGSTEDRARKNGPLA